MAKEIIFIVAAIAASLSVVALGIVTIGSIFYFIYLWGGTGAAVGVAAWGAAKAWLITIAIALPTLIVSSVTAKVAR